ncbi:MAG: tetratricopeptide repeat protein [Flavobacteriales bacterium]|nr:tetratricopeptide repeat protein [Flavobacteriales bacterium]MBK6944827.1 tetratricopeptide repeat protein [Flavobacteriales bacterium]MBK7241024.1 tetratricopeptide repeat protein [Flavobacteriales bacterium]MBK7295831.1 tetratricopeptide repeat protein [Flavobacteriales bacterium]MBP9139777.1 tetratricopeptide repeat protein [Flavobacteriales bacterium]
MIRALFIALVLIVLAPIRSYAQPGADEQLAAQYFQNGDYERAILYYEKLFRKQPTTFYYEQLYKSYVGLNDLESAQKLVKDQMKHNKDDPRYPVDMGLIFRKMGDDPKAEKEFDKALRMMGDQQGSVRQVANYFTSANEYDLALQAYERGQRSLGDGQNFYYEMANLYAAMGDVQKMVSAYMEMLAVNEAYLQQIQNSLSRYMDFEVSDDRTNILRTELLRRIQRDPQRTVYQELLIWMYIQQNDLTAAFVQSKAMDKRFDEGGMRLMDLARIALANKDYSTALKSYEYVLSLGRNDALYLQAKIGGVKVRYDQLTKQPEPVPTDLQDLDVRMGNTLTELGLNRNTIELLRDQAHLKAYYLNDHAGAIALLTEGLNIPGVDPKTQAQLKLDLGDVHLLAGEIWDASLLYSQVDLDYKYDMIGHEARLRNAKVSFYSGDFLWAQGQLNVLKASTSKLIANDAMELSLRITDNLGVDSNSVPLSFFARAELLRFQHRYDEALVVFDSLDAEYPMHSLGDDVLYERYRIAYARHRYAEAGTFLEKLLEFYPLDILVDNAFLDLGKLFEDKLNDPEKAKGFYERLLFEQTGSIFVPEARDRYRKLRGDDLEGPPEKPSLTP